MKRALRIAPTGGALAFAITEGALGWAFAALGLALVVYGATLATAITSGVWFRLPPSPATRATASRR